jgi:Tfp pilus assembly protein PilE
MAVVFKCRKDRRARSAGLTLVELVVVIAMTALLSSLLLPALSTAKEKSRRAVCQSNLRQLLWVMRYYADENSDVLPSCADNKGYYTSIMLSSAVFSELVDQEAGGTANIFYCPNLVFGSAGPVAQTNQYGVVIGYSYLAYTIGNSSKSPDYTLSPVKWPNTGTNELLADANFWTASGSGPVFPQNMAVAPHTATGAAMSQGTSFVVNSSAGTSSAGMGAAGGNIGWVDGSVHWTPMRLMQTNDASTLSLAKATW